MTQSIVIQVGQCGNQIGCRFWDLALQEHAQYRKLGSKDDSWKSFFMQAKGGSSENESFKARAVLVDMEEGVINQLLKGPLAKLLDQKQLLTDVSGAGNNWATGHLHFGTQYRERIEECVRRAAEQCDCLQCFFLFHSMGGGTGSGVGTSILSMLQDIYPDIYRFVTAVYPSADDDVVTSPYNAVLAMNQLTEHADCVLPFENQALMDITMRFAQDEKTGKIKPDKNPYDGMNDIVGKMLLNITSSSRFEGALNVDLNEITTNLVPFPRLHYLVSSQTPLIQDGSNIPLRKLDQLFTDVFQREHQMIKADPRNSLYLSCALICRGKIELSDLRRNVDRLRPSLNFIHWNTDGWKTGLCSVAPVGYQQALVALSNNTCIRHSMQNLKDRFVKLYRRKAHIHHYTSVDGMDEECFSQSLESLSSVIEDYTNLETGNLPLNAAPIVIAD